MSDHKYIGGHTIAYGCGLRLPENRVADREHARWFPLTAARSVVFGAAGG